MTTATETPSLPSGQREREEPRDQPFLRLLWPRHDPAAGSRLGRALTIAGTILVLAILGGAVAIVLDHRAAAYASAERESASLAVALAEQTARTLQETDLDLDDIAATIEAQNISSENELASAIGTRSMHDVLRAGVSGLSQIGGVSVVGADGRLLNSSLYWPTPSMNLSDRGYFRGIHDNPSLDRYIGPPILSRGRGTWTFYRVRRISATDGTFIGLVAAAIELEYFEDFYRAVAAGNGLELSLWRCDGSLLVAYPSKPPEIDTSLSDPKAFSSCEAGDQAAAAFAARRSAQQQRPVAARAVSGFPLFVAVSRSRASIEQAWRSQSLPIGLGALLSAGLLALAIASLTAQVARREASEAELRRHRDELEREVAERTRALAASEARHRDVAEVAGDWFWETDAAQRFTFISRRFGDVAGITTDSVIGLTFGEFPGIHLVRDDRTEILTAIAARRPFIGIVHRVEIRGNTRFWRVSGKPFFIPETGEFGGYRGSGTDVTASVEGEIMLNTALRRAKTAEEQAKRDRERLLDAIDIIPAAFSLWDADDRLVLCNPRHREVYEKTSDLLIPGVRFEDVLRAGAARGHYFVGEQAEIEGWIAQRLARHVAPAGGSFERRLGDGRWILIDERRTADGGIVSIRVDMTEAREREEREREREKLAALGQLAGGVAHEINNLLQPAIIFPEMVAEKLPPEDLESRGDLAAVVDGARKARDIVKNILRFARKEELVLTAIDLVAETAAALAFVRDLIPPTVSIEEKTDAPPRHCLAMANKTQLAQVFTNLVLNAVQAMQGRGTITVELHEFRPSSAEAAALGIEADRAHLTITISDTGVGMDAQTQSRVFEPFFTTKPTGQGTGLGLSVVYGILRSWNGAITVSSALGDGATFTLYVPAIIASDA